jgi:beta-xylosidase
LARKRRELLGAATLAALGGLAAVPPNATETPRVQTAGSELAAPLLTGSDSSAGRFARANPVIARDLPDPYVLDLSGTGEGPYVLTATGGTLGLWRSPDLLHWEATGASVLPDGRAPWSPDGARNWAPEIHRVNGRFVAYFTASAGRAAHREDGLAIGVAVADDALGPYHVAEEPLVGAGAYGVIDPTRFEDENGLAYLIWKTDGNCCGVRTRLLSQELTPDGTGFAPGSSPRVLLEDDLHWEGGVIEAPYMVRRGNQYFLFYSANSYHAPYVTSVARGASPLGPFGKLGRPLLASSSRVQGPGHGAVVALGSEEVFVHHGWQGDRGRFVFVSPLRWEGEWPAIHDGTTPTLVSSQASGT